MRLIWNVIALGVPALALYWLFNAMQLRERYLGLGLEPSGSHQLLKDLAAYAMTSIPRLQRIVTSGSAKTDISGRAAQLEGFHTANKGMEFFSWLTPRKSMVESKHFAENYYFWVSSANGDFLVTTRLSFYGTNASLVIPWFTMQLEGEEWNLPDDFSPLPHDLTKDPRIARDPANGVLLFENPEPMRKWRLTYRGTLQRAKTGEKRQVRCEFDLIFSPNDVFIYQTNWDEMATALSLASKPWTAQMFKNLREQNQERYASKAVRAQGMVKFIEKDEVRLGGLIASRDHLWGIRDWLFMYRYIWWPPITLAAPLTIDGVAYTSFLGAFVEYGDTLGNMVVGGLMADTGECASFSGATSMREMAPEWYDAISKRGEFIGEKHLPRKFSFQIAVLEGRYVLQVDLDRGRPAGLWSHAFSLADGDFEIHEALTKFKFQVTKAGSSKVLSTSSAVGLFEFGGNLLGKVSSDTTP